MKTIKCEGCCNELKPSMMYGRYCSYHCMLTTMAERIIALKGTVEQNYESIYAMLEEVDETAYEHGCECERFEHVGCYDDRD